MGCTAPSDWQPPPPRRGPDSRSPAVNFLSPSFVPSARPPFRWPRGLPLGAWFRCVCGGGGERGRGWGQGRRWEVDGRGHGEAPRIRGTAPARFPGPFLARALSEAAPPLPVEGCRWAGRWRRWSTRSDRRSSTTHWTGRRTSGPWSWTTKTPGPRPAAVGEGRGEEGVVPIPRPSLLRGHPHVLTVPSLLGRQGTTDWDACNPAGIPRRPAERTSDRLTDS